MATITIITRANTIEKSVSLIGVSAAMKLETRKMGKKFKNATAKYITNGTQFWENGTMVASVTYKIN